MTDTTTTNDGARKPRNHWKRLYLSATREMALLAVERDGLRQELDRAQDALDRAQADRAGALAARVHLQQVADNTMRVAEVWRAQAARWRSVALAAAVLCGVLLSVIVALAVP